MYAPARSRGFSGIGLLVLLIAVAVGLILLFGNFGGGQSHMQQVVQTKKQGDATALAVQAQQLATLIAQYRLGNEGKVPASYDDLGVPASAFNDQWGRPLRFQFEGPPRDARTLIVTSDGPDEQSDTEDDISVRMPLQF